MTDVKKTYSYHNSEESTQLYFEQVKVYPLLNFEQELALSRRIQAGDLKARQELIQGNLRLVNTIAKQYGHYGIGFIDLIQEGNLGLMHAAQKYDANHEVRFSTYASWWIKQAITRAIDNKQRAIRLPHRKEESLRKIQRAFNQLSQELMRKPSIDEISQEIGLAVNEIITILNIGLGSVSFDAEIGEDNVTMHDIIQDTTYAPEEILERKTIQDDINAMLHQLESRERDVLAYRFALGGCEKMTLKHISEKLGVSPETVRQIELRAMRKMKGLGQNLGFSA